MSPGSPRFNRRDFLKISGLLSASTALAALAGCDETQTVSQGTSPDNVSTPGTMPGLPAAGINTPAPLAIIALNRIAFGPRPDDLEAFQSLGNSDTERLKAYVQQQLNPEGIDDSALEARLKQANFQTLNKSLEELFADHIANNPYDEDEDAYWEWYILPAYELIEETFLRATYSRRQLAEVLTDFWFNHFNVYLWQDEGGPLLVSYVRDALRAHIFGNFRQMLEAVATHPSMLYYLDQNDSSDAGPNENFARELLELHTLGAENYLGVQDPNTIAKDASGTAVGYVDNDVYEVARCFTGWRISDDLEGWESGIGATGKFIYYKPWHDRFNKLVLGHYIPADQPDMKDGLDVLDLLATHPGTARFIARKLCRRLVADEPPESLVNAAAETFLAHSASPDQLKRVYETILLSEEFSQTWGMKTKRPLEVIFSMLRAVQAEFTRLPESIPWISALMGQPLFERKTPDGYPDTMLAWTNTMTTLYRWNFAVALTENWLDDGDESQASLRVDIPAQTPSSLRTPADLADYWIMRLLGRPLPAETRQAIIDFIARGEYKADESLPDEDFDYWLNGMVQLILMTPQFAMR